MFYRSPSRRSTAILFILFLLPAAAHADWREKLGKLGWEGLKVLTTTLVQESVRKLLNPEATQAELRDLRQRVAGLESYLAAEAGPKAPSRAALANLQKTVAELSTVTGATGDTLTSLQARLAALEQNVTELRQAALAASTPSTAVPPLTMSIAYLARAGGRGAFKPVRDQTTAVRWQEQGDQFEAALERFQNLCEGCSYVLRYQHR